MWRHGSYVYNFCNIRCNKAGPGEKLTQLSLYKPMLEPFRLHHKLFIYTEDPTSTREKELMCQKEDL